MTVKGFTGFELGTSVGEDYSLTGTATVSTSAKRTGTYGLQLNPASGADGYAIINTAEGRWMHWAMKVNTLPSVARYIANRVSETSYKLRLTPTGFLEVFNPANTLIGTSGIALGTGQWYWIGFRQSNGTSVVYLQIDGVDQVTATGSGTTGQGGAIGFQEGEASAADIYIDDVIVDDAGFIRDSKVAVLVPVSDNARGTNWFAADGSTTTNLYQGIDNIPAIGVATANEAANPTTAIKNTGSASGSNYDANLTSYPTVGINPSDTIIATTAYLRHAEDTSATRPIAYGLVSNPNVGVGSSFAAGGGGAAHGAEPTWGLSAVPVFTANPTITNISGNAVIRINRADATTGNVCIDLMMGGVVWTPALAITGSHTADAIATTIGRAVWTTPTDASQITTLPVLAFTMPSSRDFDMHFEMQIDTVSTFDSGNLRRIRSKISQTGWEYFNGSTFVAVPSGGVPQANAGNAARHTVQTALTPGTTYYRRVRALRA